MVWIAAFIALLISLSLDIDAINEASDYFVLAYSCVTVLLIGTVCLQRSSNNEEIDNRRFIYTKKTHWKQRYAGSFAMYERKNFVPYLVFNGVSSFLASIASKSNFTQIIEYSADGSLVNVRSTGTPPFKGCWMRAENTEEDSPYTDVEDNGKRLQMKAWWDEDGQLLRLKFLQHNPNGTVWVSDQTRKLTDDDHMHKVLTMTHEDGQAMQYEEFLRRVK